MSVQVSEPLFSEDLEETPAGGGIRPSGYFAFGLGLLSIVALLGDAWYIVPAAAVAVALFALRPVPEGLDPPAGRGWAATGLAVALFFTAWAATSQTLRRQAMVEDAEIFARNWLAVLAEGHEEFAFELTLGHLGRQIAGIDLERYYRENADAQQNLHQFTMSPTTQMIIDAGDEPEWVVRGEPVISKQYQTELVELTLVDTTGTIAPPLVITLKRTRDSETGIAEWSVDGIAPARQEITVL